MVGKWRTTGLDTVVSFFSTSYRCLQKWSANLLPTKDVLIPFKDELLTRKLPMFLLHFNEISGGRENMCLVSG